MTFRTTAKKYCEDLEALAWGNTVYMNKYPYNLLYCFGNGKFSADCNNLIKALVNGREIKDAKAGTYQQDLSLTGDVTEYGLLNECKNVTSDFSKLLQERVPHVLYMSGHVGTYLGYDVTIDGNIYNVVECTAWTGDVGHDGVIYSYVDSSGNRRYHKNGTIKSKWTKHGSMETLIDCSVLSDKAMQFISRAITYEENWMVEQFVTDKRHYLKVGADNLYNDVIFVQWYLKEYGLYDGAIDGDYGNYTKQAVIKMQNKLGLYADGEVGTNTWNAIRFDKLKS